MTDPAREPSDQSSQPNVQPGRLLKIADVVRETSLHRATIYRAIKAGTFPPSRRLGAQRVAWFEADIEAWKQSLGTETTA